MSQKCMQVKYSQKIFIGHLDCKEHAYIYIIEPTEYSEGMPDESLVCHLTHKHH